MMNKIYFFILLISFLSKAQNQTIGLFQYNEDSYSGYTLFSPNNFTYLIDNCGELVHSWESDYNTGLSVYLLNNGNLLRTCRINNQYFDNTGGSGGRIELRSWNNNLLWSSDFSNETYYQHHDIEPLPNGNILILCWEKKNLIDCILAGRNPSTLPDNELWSTYIMEIKPQGNESYDIVWEWRLWDHLIQDSDPSKPNYGQIDENPGRFNINFYKNNGEDDWLHCNSIDYNEVLDQIVIGSKKTSEFYIIDHSTSSEEAMTSNGGLSNNGGDFLYRWGNPSVYNSGTEEDQKLFGQHDVQWIWDYPQDEGKLLVFNNGQGRGYSSIEILNPNIDGFNYINNLQLEPEWSYNDPEPENFYASFISGVQKLPNGNTLICDGPHGRFFEINQEKEKVWEYINPVTDSPLYQGDIIPEAANGNGLTNKTFRCSRYPFSYPAFDGRDLFALGPIELNPTDTECSQIVELEEFNLQEKNNKTLLYITNILGQKTKPKSFSLGFYIYDDGTVEKKMIIED